MAEEIVSVDFFKQPPSNDENNDNWPVRDDSQTERLEKVEFDGNMEIIELETEKEKSVHGEETPTPTQTDKNLIELPPDHPLLEKFQKALHSHLTSQIAKLKNEIEQTRGQIDEKNKTAETLAVVIFDTEHELDCIRKQIDSNQTEMDRITTFERAIDDENTELNERLKQRVQDLEMIRKEEKEVQNELNDANALESQLGKWKEDIEGELTVKKRVEEKIKDDKKQLVRDKQHLDLLIYNLMRDVYKCKDELELLNMQIDAQQTRKTELTEMVQKANTSLDGENVQQKNLINAWNSTVQKIKTSEMEFLKAKDEREMWTEKLNEQKREIDGFKRDWRAVKEEIEHVKVACAMNQRTFGKLRDEINSGKETELILEREILEQKEILEVMNKQLAEKTHENHVNQVQLEKLKKEIENFERLKTNLEMKNLEILHEQTLNNKSAVRLEGDIKKLIGKINELNEETRSYERKCAKLQDELDNRSKVLDEHVKYKDMLEKKVEVQEKDVNLLEIEIDRTMKSITIGEERVNDLKTKLQELIDGAGGVEKTPVQLEVERLDVEIKEMDGEIMEMEKRWLQDQTMIIHLNQKSCEKQNEVNVMEKQHLILLQKNHRLEHNISTLQQLQSQTEKQIAHFHKQLEKLDLQVSKSKATTEQTAVDTVILHQKYVDFIRDSEMELARLENEIADAEEEKRNLAQELLQCHRECVYWESELKVADETKKQIDEANREGGELEAMKKEIHKMDVRLGGLKKVQMKLADDLEQSVHRREAIMNKCEAREKKTKDGIMQTRMHYARKINDLKCKVKSTKAELKALQKHIDQLNQNECEMKQTHAEIVETIQKIEKEIEQIKRLICMQKNEKQMNLDTIVRKQKAAKTLERALKSDYKLHYSNSSVMDVEEQRLTCLTEDLSAILRELYKEFPQQQLQIQRFLSMLKPIVEKN